MEEDVLDSHKLVLDQLPKWHQACATLLAMTNEVDYDVDGIHSLTNLFVSVYSLSTFLPSLCTADGRCFSRSW